MRLIKMFGLAAMAMAFASASSAMASNTSICDQDAGDDPCAAGHLVGHIHQITLSGNKAVLLNNRVNVECDVLFLGKTVGGNLGAPLTIEGDFTYTNCGACTVTEESDKSLIEVLKVADETAVVTGEGEVKVVCGLIIKCVYNGDGLVGLGKGPLLSSETNGSVNISDQIPEAVSGGVLCPEEAYLDITTTGLSVTYIAS